MNTLQGFIKITLLIRCLWYKKCKMHNYKLSNDKSKLGLKCIQKECTLNLMSNVSFTNSQGLALQKIKLEDKFDA